MCALLKLVSFRDVGTRLLRVMLGMARYQSLASSINFHCADENQPLKIQCDGTCGRCGRCGPNHSDLNATLRNMVRNNDAVARDAFLKTAC
jgi:hypothetical protein